MQGACCYSELLAYSCREIWYVHSTGHPNENVPGACCYSKLLAHTCFMSDVPCPMSDVPCPMSHVPCPMSHVWCPMSDVPCPIWVSKWGAKQRNIVNKVLIIWTVMSSWISLREKTLTRREVRQYCAWCWCWAKSYPSWSTQGSAQELASQSSWFLSSDEIV